MNITSTIKSYPYTQYADDSNISAFFTAYNQISQENLDTINGYQLPIFLNQTGPLLDWAASSIYGISRPNLSSGGPRRVGPYDTSAFNDEPFDGIKLVNSSSSFIADDLTYQRIIQWNTFKGDGFQFTLRWLKRRIQRFLTGDIFPDETYEIGVIFTSDTAVLIYFTTTGRKFLGGPLYDAQTFAGRNAAFSQAKTASGETAPAALVAALKAAINSKVLALPFQYTFSVQI